MKRHIEMAEKIRQSTENAKAKATKAREEADACPDGDDSKARDLETVRDVFIDVCARDLAFTERSKQLIANQWHIIHVIEASIPPAA